MSHNLTNPAYPGYAHRVFFKSAPFLRLRHIPQDRSPTEGLSWRCGYVTLRDDPGMPSARAAPTGPLDGESGLAPDSAVAPADASRHRYAVGVFSAPSEAHGAITALASEGCDVLVVSDTSRHEMRAAPVQSSRVTFEHVDNSGALASNLAAMLGCSGPFAALGASFRAAPGEAGAAPGLQRLFQNLVHHLATGATVVIVRAPGPEQQLHVSRALLEAHCDILLTHDVVQAAGPRPEAGGHSLCQGVGPQAASLTDATAPPLPTG